MTGVSSSCGACKFLRRRCTDECIFAPYFSYEQAAAHFAAVHKVFGASNVSKLLSHLPVHTRVDAAITISYEALARMQDPIYGCVAHIFALQQQVACLKEEIETIGNQMVNLGAEIVPYDTSNPYLAAQPEDLMSNSTDQQGLPNQHSGNAMVIQGCSSHMELQFPTENEISDGYFNSDIFESLLLELNQDYYLHEELSQECYLQSLLRSTHFAEFWAA